MMWIAGGDAVGIAAAKLGAGPWLAVQLDHAQWRGFHFYDLIFPMFVFMVGVAIAFSLGRIREQQGDAGAVSRIVRRAVLLYLIGIIYYGGLDGGLAHVRLLGVLQRIALAYLIAGLLFLRLNPRGLVIACVVILVGYWALLRFVPVPGWGPGDFAEGHNLTNWIDSRFLPGRKWDGDHDPEGILSTLPAAATCIIGVLAGIFIRGKAPTSRRSAALAVAGVALLCAGFLWGTEFPIIKKIWTSSYVLVAGGWSLLFLAAFYHVIDVMGISRWASPFVWIGMNALAIYVATNVTNFWKLADRFVGSGVQASLDAVRPGLGALAEGLVCLLLVFALAGFLHRRRVFIRL
jgi:predicted acyltransferase